MSAFLVAVFNDYPDGRPRTDGLVIDGFPTDRVELTADCDRGRADSRPGRTPHDQFAQYFRTLFTHEDEQRYPELLAACIDCGSAIIAVHPRGDVETRPGLPDPRRKRTPTEVMRHDLDHQQMEFAAARQGSTLGAALLGGEPGPRGLHLLPALRHVSHRPRPPKRAISA